MRPGAETDGDGCRHERMNETDIDGIGGIGQIVAARTALKRENGRIVCFNANRRVRGLPPVVKPATVLDVVDPGGDAVRSAGAAG